jgi:MFS family permease
VKHYSDQSSLAGNEGKLGVFGNLGWLLGPIIGGAVAIQFGLPAVFLACGAATLIGLFLFVEAKPHDLERLPSVRGTFLGSIRSYWKDPELRKLYLISFGLSFLYAAWNFVPLLLIHKGLSLGALGLVYGISALPWVLFEYPVGRLADRRYGEKVFIVIGFVFMVVASFAFSVLSTIPWLIGALLIGIIGSSLIERTHAAAFFRRVADNDVERISVWRTATGFAFVLGPLLAALIMLFAPLTFFFGIVGVLSLFFLATALALRSSRS